MFKADSLEFETALAALFVLSLVIAYILGGRKTRKDAPSKWAEGLTVRLKTQDGLYRSRFLRIDGRNFVFSAPLCRDSFVPIRAGESMTIEVTTPDGIQVLKSTVQSREESGHELHLSKPEEIAFFNRRLSHRVCYGQGVEIDVEDTRAQLIDVSERGIKFQTWQDLNKGERINVRLPWEEAPVAAWIIDLQNLTGKERGTTEYRAIFEELVDPPEALPKEQAS